MFSDKMGINNTVRGEMMSLAEQRLLNQSVTKSFFNISFPPLPA